MSVAHAQLDPARPALDPIAGLFARSRWSPTAISLHQTCPLKFAVRYALGEQEPANEALLIGGVVHEALAWTARLPRVDRQAITDEQLADSVRRAWGDPARRAVRAELFAGSRELEATAGLRAVAMVRRAWEGDHAQLTDADPVLVEDFVVAVLPSGQRVAGRVDRVDPITLPGGIKGLQIVDYKSGRPRVDEGGELARDPGAQGYAVACWQRWGRPVRVVHLYLGEGCERRVWDPEQDDIEAAAAALDAAIGQITGQMSYGPTPSPQLG